MRRSAPRVGQLVGRSRARRVGQRVDADDLDAAAAQLELDRFVAEQGDVLERADRLRIDALGERIAAVGEVVVAEDDEARPEPVEQPLELAHPRAARDEVARDADEVRPALGRPTPPPRARRECPRDGTPRWKSERCAIRSPSSSAGTPSSCDLEDALPQPARLEPPPGRDSRDRGGEREQEPGQTESFSVTGVDRDDVALELQLRASSPAATPTSCERCRIGIWKSLPVCLLAASTARRRARGGRAGTA